MRFSMEGAWFDVEADAKFPWLTGSEPFIAAASEPRASGSGTKKDDSTTRKKQFCVFCDTAISNLSRHLLAKHASEERVKPLSTLVPKDPFRRRILSKLRTEGYLRAQGGKVKIRKGASAYVACPECGAGFGKSTSHRHFAKCTGRAPPKNLLTIATGKELISDNMVGLSDSMKNEIVPGMRCDPGVLDAIVKDKYIVQFGNDQCLRSGNKRI